MKLLACTFNVLKTLTLLDPSSELKALALVPVLPDQRIGAITQVSPLKSGSPDSASFTLPDGDRSAGAGERRELAAGGVGSKGIGASGRFVSPPESSGTSRDAAARPTVNPEVAPGARDPETLPGAVPSLSSKTVRERFSGASGAAGRQASLAGLRRFALRRSPSCDDIRRTGGASRRLCAAALRRGMSAAAAPPPQKAPPRAPTSKRQRRARRKVGRPFLTEHSCTLQGLRSSWKSRIS
jgi:hypothetical protein